MINETETEEADTHAYKERERERGEDKKSEYHVFLFGAFSSFKQAVLIVVSRDQNHSHHCIHRFYLPSSLFISIL
jgi:hypothetical protein